MPYPFPLLSGNILAQSDGKDPILFQLELDENPDSLKAVTLTFDLDMTPVTEDGNVKMVENSIEDSWPAIARMEMLLQVPEGTTLQAESCVQTTSTITSACRVPGTDPVLIAYSFTVPENWLMPAKPYLFLIHRHDLAKQVDACIQDHNTAFPVR